MLPQRCRGNPLVLFLKELGVEGIADEEVARALLRAIADDDAYGYIVDDLHDCRIDPPLVCAAGCRKEVERYLAALADKSDPPRRQRVAVALGFLGLQDPRVVDALLDTIESGDVHRDQTNVAVALGRVGGADPRTVQALLAMVWRATVSFEVEPAAVALAAIARGDQNAARKVIGELVCAVCGSSYERWNSVADALETCDLAGLLGTDPDAVRAIVGECARALLDPDIRRCAIRIIGHIAPGADPVFSKLLQLFRERDHDCKYAAHALFVGGHAHEAGMAEVLAFFEDVCYRFDLRAFVERLLERCPDVAARYAEPLLAVLEGDAAFGAAEYACKVLRILGIQDARVCSAVRARLLAEAGDGLGRAIQWANEMQWLGDSTGWLHLLQSSEASWRLAAMDNLIGDRGSCPHSPMTGQISLGLEDPDDEVRARSAVALARTGMPSDPRVVAALREAVDRHEGRLRRHALLGLECLGLDL